MLNYLDPRYEQQGRKDNVKWRSFLKKIGIEEYPNPEKIIIALQVIESTGFSEENTKKSRDSSKIPRDTLERFLFKAF